MTEQIQRGPLGCQDRADPARYGQQPLPGRHLISIGHVQRGLHVAADEPEDGLGDWQSGRNPGRPGDQVPTAALGLRHRRRGGHVDAAGQVLS